MMNFDTFNATTFGAASDGRRDSYDVSLYPQQKNGEKFAGGAGIGPIFAENNYVKEMDYY